MGVRPESVFTLCPDNFIVEVEVEKVFFGFNLCIYAAMDWKTHPGIVSGSLFVKCYSMCVGTEGGLKFHGTVL
jgi:hypothetical protein